MTNSWALSALWVGFTPSAMPPAIRIRLFHFTPFDIGVGKMHLELLNSSDLRIAEKVRFLDVSSTRRIYA